MGAAGSLFEQASQSAERKGALSLALSSGECAARCLALQGRLHAARQKSEQVIALGQLGQTRHPLIVGALLTLGEIAYQQNDLARVEPLLQQAIALAETLGTLVRGQQCWAYQQLARLRRAQGDPAGAAQAIEQADAVARAVENGFYLRALAARRRSIQCEALTLQERVYMPTLFYALDESQALTAACEHVAQGRPQEALPILDQLLDSAQQGERGLAVIELHVWRALAYQALGQDEPALSALEEALALAAPQHCQRPFLDVGPAVGSLLRKAAQRGIGGSLARSLLERSPAETPGASIEQVRPASSTPRDLFLLEPLSARELDVLRLIAEGLSNKEIAERLYIGVGTVKWYATTIYSKLDVGSRTQAVARAQALGLIP
jgi:LuxR family maltose regulon positive regulatory protein